MDTHSIAACCCAKSSTLGRRIARLFAAAREPKRFLRISGADHNNALGFPVLLDAVASFAREVVSGRRPAWARGLPRLAARAPERHHLDTRGASYD